MSEENKAILRRVTDEVFTQGNLDVVDEVFSPEYVLHDPGLPGGELRGTDSFKQQWVSMFRNAFPDLQLSVEDQVAEGDRVELPATRDAAPTGVSLWASPLPGTRWW